MMDCENHKENTYMENSTNKSTFDLDSQNYSKYEPSSILSKKEISPPQENPFSGNGSKKADEINFSVTGISFRPSVFFLYFYCCKV